mgnify:CR=1 FL=1
MCFHFTGHCRRYLPVFWRSQRLRPSSFPCSSHLVLDGDEKKLAFLYFPTHTQMCCHMCLYMLLSGFVPYIRIPLPSDVACDWEIPHTCPPLSMPVESVSETVFVLHGLYCIFFNSMRLKRLLSLPRHRRGSPVARGLWEAAV